MTAPKISDDAKDIIRELLEAMKEAERVGCVDHLDCCDDGGAFWYDAVERAEEALK